MAKMEVSGSYPHDAVSDSPFPVPIGGVASSSVPTAVSAGDAVQAHFDTSGRLGTVDGGPGFSSAFTFTTSADMQTAAALTAAPTSGQKLVITDIVFSTDTAMSFEFEEESAATTNFIKVYCAANSVIQITPRGKLKLATADKKLFGDASAAGNVAVTVFYYSEL